MRHPTSETFSASQPIRAVALVALVFEDPDDRLHTFTEQEQRDAMRRLAAQPAGKDLPPAPLFLSEQTLTFRSVVLGCTIELTTDNRSPRIELSESILAAVESLLATSVLEGIAPRVGLLRVRVKHSDFVAFPFSSEWTDVEGLPAVDVRCNAFAVSGLAIDQQEGIKKAVADLVTHILARGFFIEGEATLQRLFYDEQGLTRALDFTGSFGAIANTLGRSPRLAIQDWAPDSQTHFELRRNVEWNADERRQAREAAKPKVRPSELPLGEGPAPEELFDVSRIKHSDISFESLIREALWDKARWRAIGWAAAHGVPPWMVLGFENGDAAAEILTHLVRDIGNEDPKNRLRITIVKGISKKNPTHYRVIIGSNVDPADFEKFGAVMFRVHTMTPTSTVNLDGFLSAYNEMGAYLVGIGVVDPRNPSVPEPMRHGYVLKRTLQVREAWTIGVNDLDGPGIMPDDDVVIPSERKKDAPVLGLLQWKKQRSHRVDRSSKAGKAANRTTSDRKNSGKSPRLKKGQSQRRK